MRGIKRRNHRNRNNRRRGTIALILLLAFTLLVGTFALSLGRRAMDERQRQIQYQQVRLLERAIETVKAANVPEQRIFRLPIDPEVDHWIDVQLVSNDSESERYQATIRLGSRIGLSIERSRNGE
ncbi:hypothetical protein LOC67_09995 [Stieleria sp. JC731]|uniref:hypothetical protein n=1 Tax=Pirellulaceae TaxID=2691357 RepID=UPI001E523990|nr:hypothetical protein [Stieleria sp. JC731]MCC9600898.1 hypothetical protein [Stieleria sp. JC731]